MNLTAVTLASYGDQALGPTLRPPPHGARVVAALAVRRQCLAGLVIALTLDSTLCGAQPAVKVEN
jgi:hypothetical protein